MKRTLSLALVLIFAFALALPAFAAVPDGAFAWDEFTGRDPKSTPAQSTNGASIWWDNWVNMRSSVDDGVANIQFRPKEFDPEDYDSEDEYYASALDWMGNWGEAIDMWSLDGISWCKYLTIRIKGDAGGEEAKLLLHFQPEDGDVYAKRFSDLVLKDGSKAKITTGWQDVTIDLEKSGLPGMTNRMHIRAFAECTVSIDELYFTDPVAPIDSTSRETILGAITVKATGDIGAMPIKQYIADLSAPASSSGGDTPPSAAKTGDAGNILLAVLALFLSAGAAVLVIRKVRA